MGMEIIEFNIYLIISLIVSISGAGFGIFCLVLRSKRLKSGNVVCNNKKLWLPCLFLIANPLILLFISIFEPYTYCFADITLTIISVIYLICFWINGCITFHDDGFISTNAIFMKKFYSYSDIVETRIAAKKIVTRSNNRLHARYVYYGEIYVKQENTAQCKKLSMEVDSCHFHEFMRMIDTKRPKLRNVQEIHLGNGTYAKIYDRP